MWTFYLLPIRPPGTFILSPRGLSRCREAVTGREPMGDNEVIDSRGLSHARMEY